MPCELEDLLKACGEVNTGGLSGQFIHIVPVDDIDETALPAIDVAGTTITGNIVLKPLKKFFRMYYTDETGKIDYNLVGERDGRSYEHLLEFFHPGGKEETIKFMRGVSNTPVVIIANDGNGRQKIMGMVAVDPTNTGTYASSLQFPAYLETGAGTTGAAAGDRAGQTISFKGRASHTPLTYEGTIDLDDLT